MRALLRFFFSEKYFKFSWFSDNILCDLFSSIYIYCDIHYSLPTEKYEIEIKWFNNQKMG